MIPKILSFVRWLWGCLIPATLRHFFHVGVQRGQAYLLDAGQDLQDQLHCLQQDIDQWRSRLGGHSELRVVGLFSASHGISRGASLTCRALDQLGLPYVRVDASSLVHSPKDAHLLEAHALGWIIQMNPPELNDIVRNGGPEAMKGPRYGYWAYELPTAPAEWRASEAYVEEIWAVSKYTAKAFGSFSKSVRTMPHPIILADYAQVVAAQKRAEFSAIAFFDFNSSVARKNPGGAISAFKAAFGDDPSTCLTIKTQNGHLFPEILDQLKRSATSNITIIDEVWDHGRVLSEIKSADVLLSLHRAEGFGLVMAEAMALGTPVIATGWSGNMDFTDATCALLTPYALIPVRDEQGIYQGQHWADPDLAFASDSLRRLRAEPNLGQRLSKAAREAIKSKLSPEAWYSHFPLGLRWRIFRSAQGRRSAPAPNQ